MSNIEAVSDNFDIDKFYQARALTIQAVQEIALKVEIGMTETDGHDLINKTLDNLGAEKKWHPNKFRIGKNTTKAFKEKSDPTIELKEEDIFFVDIGPVFEGYEGDFGKTFTTGNNLKYKKIADDVQTLFKNGERYWLDQKINGHDLYQFLQNEANKLGYELNTAMTGHRLADFPHAVYHRGSLSDFNDTPIEDVWVMEVLIRHSDQDYGAFYEDIIKKAHSGWAL